MRRCGLRTFVLSSSDFILTIDRVAFMSAATSTYPLPMVTRPLNQVDASRISRKEVRVTDQCEAALHLELEAANCKRREADTKGWMAGLVGRERRTKFNCDAWRVYLDLYVALMPSDTEKY
jgi:hypothetical protein